MADDGSQQRKTDFRTAVEDVKALATVLAMEAWDIQHMSKGRFTLGLGAGENLNEHVVGAALPSPHERQAMLREAIDIIERLFEGEEASFEGEYFVLDRAKLYDRPDTAVPLAIAAGGPKAAEIAAEHGGLFTTEPSEELVAAYRKAGGKGPRYAEVALSYAKSEQEAQKVALERFSFSMFDWSVNAELPTPAAFEAAVQYLRPEDMAKKIPCGPDPERHVEAIRKYLKAGFDHLVLLGIGPDQAGFLRFYQEELAPRLKKL